MLCNGCGNDVAARIRGMVGKDGKYYEMCDECGKVPPVWLPDVYLGSKGGTQIDEQLCNAKGEPIPFQTKREKAAIMNMLQVRQADSAERQHGFRNEMYLNRKKYYI